MSQVLTAPWQRTGVQQNEELKNQALRTEGLRTEGIGAVGVATLRATPDTAAATSIGALRNGQH